MANNMKKPPLPRKRRPEMRPDPNNMNRNRRSLVAWVVIGLFVLYFMRINSALPPTTQEITYKEFIMALNEGKIASAVLSSNIVSGDYKENPEKRFKVFVMESPELVSFISEHVEHFNIQPPKTLFMSIFLNFAPVLLFIAFLWFFYSKMSAGGGKVLSFGKSRARLVSEADKKVTFMDVAGVDEAKEELFEIVDFLKDPKKFQKLGGKIPKGVLLIGPPGTGKTLLAKAIAGEADVSFFTISGSDFVEMFVGIGASRVRDTFEQARKSVKTTGKGSILFIDEIDAVGRSRGAGWGGGHDEREQTLNALLVEMDGFDTFSGLILVAATNRPDVLDPALLRPGRFDRIVVIDRPDIKGREGVLKVHSKNIILDKDVDLNIIARQTAGFSGADLANLMNEAALLAARYGKKSVTMAELQSAFERIAMGLERKSRVPTEKAKKRTSVHESGHALLSVLLPHADPVHKVTVIPRGMALGYMLPLTEDKTGYTKDEFLAEITVFLGGRVAEMIVYNEQTTGAKQDIEEATKMAHRMVCEFGMSELLGTLAYGKDSGPVFLARDFVKDNVYSQSTLENIDKEIKKIVDDCYKSGMELLMKHKGELEKLSEILFRKEILSGEDVKKILAGTWVEPQPASPAAQAEPDASSPEGITEKT